MCKLFRFKHRIRGDFHIQKSTPRSKQLRGVAVITLGETFFNDSNLSSWKVLYTFR